METLDLPGSLRRFLAEVLPPYMVPAAVVVLEELPRLPNGKVDRRSLPAPEWAGSRESWVAPRTPTEEIVSAVFSEVLHVERVGAESSFFDLGGHSLLATQVVSRLRSAFGVEVPLRKIFETPTVAGLGREIEVARMAGQGVEVPPIVWAPRDQSLPLSFGQQRLWFLAQLEPESAAYNIPSAFRLEGPLRP